MEKAENLIVAQLVIDDEDFFITGYKSDIQRLDDAGVVERAWDIRLDNGHRPYPAPKKRICYDIAEAPNDSVKNAVTGQISGATGLEFAQNLHRLTETYLLRKAATFWSDLEADFADGGGLPEGLDPGDYYAVYRGYILANANGIKFVRL